MLEKPAGARISSARRRPGAQSPVFRGALALGLVLATLLVVHLLRPDPPEPAGAAPAAPTPTSTPAATRAPTPTPGLVRDGSGWVDATVLVPATPTTVAPTAAAPQPRRPAPTPRIPECAGYRWSTFQVFSPSAQVKVDIRVTNRCPYDLGPGNLWFEITGWRDGNRIQSVRGHPFETIRRGRSGDLSIGLPGAEDWYDEIEVVVLD
jgi:hypothetical protein